MSEKAYQEGKDYNLWEMYEFHGKGIGGVTMNQGTKGNKQVITKDVGGIITVKKKSGESQELRGRAGLISAVVEQLQAELAVRIAELIQSSALLIVADAGKEAAGKASALEGLLPTLAAEVQQAANERKVDLEKVHRVSVTAGGSMRVHGSGGKFIKSPLHGQKISVN
jgi:hypothetical protein